MGDEQLIDEVARLWRERGGDAEGMLYTWGKIVQRLQELELEDAVERRLV